MMVAQYGQFKKKKKKKKLHAQVREKKNTKKKNLEPDIFKFFALSHTTPHFSGTKNKSN